MRRDFLSGILSYAHGAHAGVKEAAVIGMPISHSRSPAIFDFLARERGVADLHYQAIALETAALPDFLRSLRKNPEWIGLNVTIPHKETILGELDSLSSEAKAIGAANVVEARGGKLVGHNTDVYGIIRTLETNGAAIRGQSAFLYGAGGAARAVAYALGKMGAAEVVIMNRNADRARKVVAALAPVFPATKFGLAGGGANGPFTLVVNSTPVGMRGFTGAADSFEGFAELAFRPGALAFDSVYDPEVTLFLELAKARGLRTIGGLDMLIYQALATWEIWLPTSDDAATALHTKERLSAFLRAEIREARPIFLAGFMGVGKSTVGAALAKALGWSFVDTDAAVIAKAGKNITEIFAENGEAAFRSLEADAVDSACTKSKIVVALGGGALLDPSSLRKIQGAGRLVFLSADAESLDDRLAGTANTRPLLAGLAEGERKAKIRQLLAAREPIYRQARHRIETDGLAPEEIAARIAQAILQETA